MRIQKIRFLMFLLACFSFANSYGQSRIISGTITDSIGQPLVGVTVKVRGTSITTKSEIKGRFKIAVSDKSFLVISHVGFRSQDLRAEDNIKIIMRTESQGLEDVVVTALNIKRDKKSLGYATATIKGEDLIKAGNVQNPLTALYGQAAGMGIEVSSSGPTGGVKINIRGNASLNGNANTRPLIVVDGIPIYDANSSMASRNYDPLNSFDYGTGINDINAEDIESIEILKGAKATVLYGSLAGNGVMMITTKKGRSTRGWGVNLSLQTSFDHPLNFMDWQNEYGTGTSIYDTAFAKDPTTGTMVRALSSNRFNFGPKFDNARVLNYDNTYTTYHAYPNNYNDVFRNTVNTDATIAISGASDKGNMRLSYTNKDYNGILKNFYQKNNDISFNGRFKASDFATFEVVTNLYNVQTQNRLPNIGRLVANGINRDADFKTFSSFYKDHLGQQTTVDNSVYRFPYVFTGSGDGYFPMLWRQNENRNIDNKMHFVGSAKVELKFTNWLGLTLNAGTDYTDWEYMAKNKVTQIYPTVAGGGFSDAREIYKVQNYTAFLNFNHKYIHNNLDVFAFAGPSYYQNDYSKIGVNTVGGLQFQNWYSLSGSQSQSGLFSQAANEDRSSTLLTSVLGNVSLGWKSIYYLELTARKDWTSTLAPGYNSFFYPGASLSYNFSQNIHIPQLSYGKLRLSVADVGRGAPNAYWAYPAYSLGLVQGTGAVTIASPSSLFASNIKPERKREIEIGFDTKWFKVKQLEIDFSFYTATNYNQIIDLGLSPTTGYPDAKINAGKFKNWGYELFSKYTAIQNKIHRLDISLNIANQYSKVIDLYPGISQYAIAGSGAFSQVAVPGRKIGDIQAYDYARDPKSGQKIVNANTGTYGPDRTKLVTVGNVNPYLIGGLFFDYYYKGLSLHMGMNYKFGGTFLSYSNYYLLGQGLTKESLKYRDAAHGGLAYYINGSNKNVQLPSNASAAPSDSKDGIVYHNGVILDGVKDDGTGNLVKNDIIISDYAYYQTFIHDMSDWFQSDKLYKNDYLKLREVSISYTLPQKLSAALKMQKLVFSAFGRNLFYLYKTLPNIDPESSMGSNSFIENTSLPQVRTIGIKLNASF